MRRSVVGRWTVITRPEAMQLRYHEEALEQDRGPRAVESVLYKASSPSF
jgi:hypothetical protein